MDGVQTTTKFMDIVRVSKIHKCALKESLLVTVFRYQKVVKSRCLMKQLER